MAPVMKLATGGVSDKNFLIETSEPQGKCSSFSVFLRVFENRVLRRIFGPIRQ
jgi:hypothetical protein